ncbi:DMT family transporter [Ignatzschineria sp. LJL83]
MQQEFRGHLLAIATILLWGTTFVSTKVLLQHDLSPVEILFSRFLMGFCFLILLFPKRLTGTTLAQEKYFALAGLCGITLYYLFENNALIYTFASNAALIASTSPFFTVLLAKFFLKEEVIRPQFFIGMILSFTGVGFMSFSNASEFSINLKGDFLALLAAIIWSFYSIFSKKISTFGYNTIQTTRRTFFYGLLFMLPMLPFSNIDFQVSHYLNQTVILNLIFLGLGASAICFVTWNLALRALGAIKASLYINLVPMVTVVFSVLILHEKITLMSGLGIALVLSGLFISQFKKFKKVTFH